MKRDQDPVPPSSLGELVAEFGPRVPIVLIFLLVSIVVFSVGTWNIWAGLIAGVTVAGGCLLLVRIGRLKVKVYPEGLIYRTRAKSEIWRWNEVEEFSVLLEKREIRTAPRHVLEFVFEKVMEALVMALLPKAMKYRVSYELRRPGHKLVIDSSIRDHKKLGEIARSLVSSHRLPLLLASVRAGDIIPFGEFLIGPEGVTHTRRKQQQFLPWNAVAAVTVSEYSVTVNQVGEKACWASAGISEVPNAVVLAELAGRVIQTRSTRTG